MDNLFNSQISIDESLIKACFHLEVELIRYFLEQGADPNAITPNDWHGFEIKDEGFEKSPLNLIASREIYQTRQDPESNEKLAKAAELLLEFGANIQGGDEYETPLQQAVERGYFDLTKILISNGADINAKSEDGFAVLHSACMGDFQLDNTAAIFNILIENGADVNQQDDRGWTPAHYILSKLNISLKYTKAETARKEVANSLAILTELVKNGANLNIADNQGQTALMMAQNHPEVLEALKASGLDLSALDDLYSENALEHKLIQACLDGKVDLVEKYLSEGADPNFPSIKSRIGSFDYEGETIHTPLGLIASNYIISNRLEMMKVLLSYGANPNSPNDKSALLSALAFTNDREIASLLIEHGANVNAKDELNNSALHYTARAGSYEQAENLIKLGADVRAVNSDGNTPLHFAAKFGSYEIMHQLIDEGADINALNNDLDTPTHLLGKFLEELFSRQYGSYFGHFKDEIAEYTNVVQKIIQSPDFDVNIVNSSGKSISDYLDSRPEIHALFESESKVLRASGDIENQLNTTNNNDPINLNEIIKSSQDVIEGIEPVDNSNSYQGVARTNDANVDLSTAHLPGSILDMTDSSGETLF